MKKSEKTIFLGWEISTDENSFISVKVDGNKVENVQRTNRQDVYETYCEEYAGFLDADTIGWQAIVDTTSMESGEHEFTIECCDENNQVLANKSISFSLE